MNRSTNRSAANARLQRATAILLVLASTLVVGCRPRGTRTRRAPRPVTTAAVGRPDTCHDRAVDPFGDGTPAPDDLRCSYVIPGGTAVKLHGQVLTAAVGAQPGEPVGEVEVVVYAVEDGGARREVARTRADAQGSFTVGAMLPVGEYAVGVAGKPASARAVRLGTDDPDDIMIIVPRDL